MKLVTALYYWNSVNQLLKPLCSQPQGNTVQHYHLNIVLLQPCWVVLHWNSSFQMWVQWSTCKTVPLEEEFLSYLHVATATTHYVHNTEKWFLTGKNGYFHSSASVCCPSISSQTGQTALMAASFRGHLPIVERLLAAGAQPDLQKKVRTANSVKVGGVLINKNTLYID